MQLCVNTCTLAHTSRALPSTAQGSVAATGAYCASARVAIAYGLAPAWSGAPCHVPQQIMPSMLRSSLIVCTCVCACVCVLLAIAHTPLCVLLAIAHTPLCVLLAIAHTPLCVLLAITHTPLCGPDALCSPHWLTGSQLPQQPRGAQACLSRSAAGQVPRDHSLGPAGAAHHLPGCVLVWGPWQGLG